MSESLDEELDKVLMYNREGVNPPVEKWAILFAFLQLNCKIFVCGALLTTLIFACGALERP